jgi:hypothetical protein
MACGSVDEQLSVFTGKPRSWLPEGGECRITIPAAAKPGSNRWLILSGAL